MKHAPLYLALFCAGSLAAEKRQTPAPSAVRLRHFTCETPLGRAHRPAALSAVIANDGDADLEVTARLLLPEGMMAVRGGTNTTVRVDAGEEQEVNWTIEASEAAACELKLQLDVADSPATNAAIAMRFLPEMKMRKPPYIPEPVPAPTRMLVGAHHCPLWEAGKPQMWANIVKHPERTPALGFYVQENPEVADWETKWTVDHGVSFFIYCSRTTGW